MGSVSWRTNRSLGNSIRLYPQHFDYYQLVNLLLNFGNKGDAAGTEVPDTLAGDDGGKIDRALRIRADIRFDFPPSLVSYYQQAAHDRNGKEIKQTLGVNGFGLAGIYGALPQSYSEWLYREIANGKHEIADFLDIFNHKLLSLRYQVRARTRVSLSAKQPNESPVAAATNALMGFSNPQMFKQLGVKPRLMQTYAGLLANCRGSMQIVKCLLGSVFATCVKVEQLVGQWRAIEANDQSRIGSSGQNRVLGVNTVLGTRSWDQQGMIKITLGPLLYQRMLALMPGGALHAQLVALIRFLSNRRWDCQVRLQIQRSDIPTAVLSSRPAYGPQPDAGNYPMMVLGRTSWLNSSFTTDGETGFTVRMHAA